MSPPGTRILDTQLLFWIMCGELSLGAAMLARIENAALVTRDRRIIAYGRAGHVAVLAA